jgi:autophagy-related protein 5
MSATLDDVRSTSWAGSIPVVLSLAQTSLSSPTMPPPIHTLVPRHTYLHVGLRSATGRFHKFAPPVISSPIARSEPHPGESCEEQLPGKPQSEDSYPVCWFEDEETHTALRWHLFAGVLWDMKQKSKSVPWKIKLHFNNYPSSQILPMEVSEGLTVVERTFKNSLKQALFLQQGTAKVAMNMSKQSHELLWDSILTSNYQLYQQVDHDLQSTHNMLPIRLMIDAKPPIQKPLRVKGAYCLAMKRSGTIAITM